MKPRKNSASSLEMLLDTMCNTFGAVIFLCLTLVVLLSARTSLPPPETPADENELLKLQQEYDRLSDELTLLVRTRHLTVDAAEALRLELALSAQKVELKKMQLQICRTREEIAATRQQSDDAEKRCRFQEEELNRRAAEEAALEAALQKLKNETRKAERTQELNFSRREESHRNPYYLILTPQGNLHKLGMDRTGGEFLPNGEVEYQRSGKLFTCSARPGSGRPLMLADGSLNPDLWSLFLELEQQGRPPFFLIAKESAAVFFQLRFELKKRQIRFSWSPLAETGRISIELTRAPVHWEYAQ